jgi:hypothetical protein
VYFVFDSNIVHLYAQGTTVLSSIPKIGHSAFLNGYDKKRISLFVAKRIIQDDWIKYENVYLAPNKDEEK